MAKVLLIPAGLALLLSIAGINSSNPNFDSIVFAPVCLSAMPGVAILYMFSNRIERYQKKYEERQRLITEYLDGEITSATLEIDKLHSFIALQAELSDLREQQVEAVVKAMQAAISENYDRLAAANKRDQIRYFSYGVVVSIPIGILINLVT